jgi:hypothetical protein
LMKSAGLVKFDKNMHNVSTELTMPFQTVQLLWHS